MEMDRDRRLLRAEEAFVREDGVMGLVVQSATHEHRVILGPWGAYGRTYRLPSDNLRASTRGVPRGQ